MRVLLLILGIAFVFIEGNSQAVDFEFFQTTEKRNGKQYAKALIPAKIDSVMILQTVGFPISEPQTATRVDTHYFQNIRFLKEPSDFNQIADFADTASQYFVISAASKYDERHACNGNYEWIKESFEKIPGLKSWVLTTDKNRKLPKSWTVEPIQNYGTKSRLVVRSPCNYREVEIPARYQKLIYLIPKREPTKEEQLLIEELTTDRITYSYTYHYHIRRVSKQYTYKEYEYTLTKEATIDTVEVYSSKEINKQLPNITKQLVTHDLLSNSQTNNLQLIQEALLKYQQKHSFPIGQFDKQSIDSLLKQ